MKKRILRWLLALLVTLPMAFALIFFGFLPPRFDAVIYTNNVVGEGTCSSYLIDDGASFSYLYKGNAYFGSELKTLRLFDLKYNVGTVGLYLYDVESADIVSFDISVFGRTVSHLSSAGLTHPFTPTTRTAVTSEEVPIVHLDQADAPEGMSIGFPGGEIIPGYVWALYGGFILLVAALLAALLALVFERLPGIVPPLLGASALMVTLIVGGWICGSLPYVNYTDFLLNWLMLFGAATLVNALTLPGLGTALVALFTLVWYIANRFVIQFRNKPIMPADLKALGTAREVAGGYVLTPGPRMILGALAVLLMLGAMIAARRRLRQTEKRPLKTRLLRRGLGVAAAAAMLFFGVHNPAFDRLNTFQWDAKVLEGFHREGIVLTFIKSALSAHVKRPEGYSRQAVDGFLADYAPESSPEGVRPTRILMVMNEAFSDLRTVGLDPDIDVMPFIDSLDENTLEGSLYVSVFGGGTCNTEFEALTGNTLAFLGAGAYPYTENVTRPMFSLARYFADAGYAAEAFHAGNADNWNRNRVYPNLGFDVFHDIEDYPDITRESYLHDYVTDETDYAFLQRRDADNAGTPRFLFDVTIQNHSDYDHFKDVPEAQTLADHGDMSENARVYLSLVKVSDDALRELVEAYRDSDEPTMIVFFGDHQPSLPRAAQSQVYTAMQGYLDHFKSKFVIWTNYATDTVHGAAISANYLPWLILERGNFPLPPYVRLLRALHEKYPVISSQGVVDAEGNVYDNVAELMDDPLVRRYQYVQYANLFDEIDPAWFEVK